MNVDSAIQLFRDNQFLTGGVVAVVLGTLLAQLREWPKHIWRYIRDQLVVTVDVPQNDVAFSWLVKLFDEHPSAVKMRSCMVHSMWNEQGHHDIRIGPSVGRHLIWDQKRPIWLERSRQQLTGAVWGPAHFDTFRMQTFGRDKTFLLEFLSRARTLGEKVDPGKVKIYVNTGDRWASRLVACTKTLDKVILKDGQAEELLQDAEWFMKSRLWYYDKGIPYRRGWLLHGPPGCGKTSVILALAYSMGTTIYMLNAGDRSLSDGTLFSLVSTMRPNSLLVIEDVDAAFRGRSAKDPLVATPEPNHPLAGQSAPPPPDQNGVTFSGLLNAIDGILGGDGRLLLMTSNHPEKLDPALLRPGRVDKRALLDKADGSQAVRIFATFYPDRRAEGDTFGRLYVDNSMSPAELQELFLTNVQDCNEAIRVYASRAFKVPKESEFLNVRAVSL